jgi:hypothetical protein
MTKKDDEDTPKMYVQFDEASVGAESRGWVMMWEKNRKKHDFEIEAGTLLKAKRQFSNIKKDQIVMFLGYEELHLTTHLDWSFESTGLSVDKIKDIAKQLAEEERKEPETKVSFYVKVLNEEKVVSVSSVPPEEFHDSFEIVDTKKK